MQKQKNKETGITLIALVVTIIVLIILAGVSIAMIVGENGIITQAQREAQETELKGDEEKIRLAMSAAQIENNGNSNIEKDDLEIALLENGTKSIVVDNEDGTRNIIFLDSKKIYKLNNDGTIEDTNSDFDSIYVAPDSQDEARNEGVIGTDGQPVDMDLWEYTLMEDGTYGLNDEESLIAGETRTSSYRGEFINGRIEGTIPQFIKAETDENFVEVTDLSYLFFKNTDLEVTPEIPSAVINMRATFNTTKIRKLPEIPNRVTNMYGTFASCTNLTDVTVIPDSVINMQGTFAGCSSLTEAPDIPNGVTNMQATFDECSSLKKSPIIPNTVINMYGTFRNCTSLITASSIPSSVEIITGTFEGCSNLQGELEINSSANGTQLGADFANRKDYNRCLLNATTEGKISLKLTGNCIMLQEIIDEANNTNITLMH